MSGKSPLWILCLLAATPVVAEDSPRPTSLRAGAAAINIDPPKFPVLKNGGFLQASADRITQSLFARSLVLASRNEQIAICVVDSCMLSRELCDEAKELAHNACGIPTNRILISATHTHSAPSAMRALGCNADPEYPQFLVPKIVESIQVAAARLRPAQAGWGVADAGHYTNTRRWIFLPHKMRTDPFGEKTVRAMMHPGHANPDTAGPSGPKDPDLTVLSVQDLDGRPVAVLGNLSMHYYGAEGLSSDYTGRICELLNDALSRDDASEDVPPFVPLMSQGTSGDLHYMDYSLPQADQPFRGKADGFERYCRGLADLALQTVSRIRHQPDLPLAMFETTLKLQRRLPDGERLAWADKVASGIVDVPKSQPEVYAREALWIRDNPQAELKLQAIRLGELGITAMPNEVYGLTGLKIKMQSPLLTTMNIELANGGEGYIPPPEQHQLGGYTTWPARTAGLEVQAEPKITESVLSLLETVSQRPRRVTAEEIGPHGRTILALRPLAWWRMSPHSGDVVPDSSGHQHSGELSPGYALFLDGPQGAPFASTERGNRCVHFAGGQMNAPKFDLSGDYSVSLWFWNAMPEDVRAVTGYLCSIGVRGSNAGDHVGITGAANAPGGRLFAYNGDTLKETIVGTTQLPLHTWHHLVLTRTGQHVSIFLDGRLELSSSLTDTRPAPSSIVLAGRCDGLFSFEGKLDEIAVYGRELAPAEAAELHAAP